MEPTNNFAETIRDITLKTAEVVGVNGLPFYRDKDGDMILLEKAALRPLVHEFEFEFLDFSDYLRELGILSKTVGADFLMHSRCEISDLEPRFFSVLDFCSKEDRTEPGPRKMRICFNPEISRQIKMWKSKNLQWISQAEFGDFIEINIDDIHGDQAAKLLDVARNLEANVSSKFQSTIRPVSGDMKLRWESETNTGECAVPQEFPIVIPLYKYSDPYKLNCALQYRVRDGSAQFRYRIVNLDAAIEDCFNNWRYEASKAEFYHSIAII